MVVLGAKSESGNWVLIGGSKSEMGRFEFWREIENWWMGVDYRSEELCFVLGIFFFRQILCLDECC